MREWYFGRLHLLLPSHPAHGHFWPASYQNPTPGLREKELAASIEIAPLWRNEPLQSPCEVITTEENPKSLCMPTSSVAQWEQNGLGVVGAADRIQEGF